MKSLHVLTHLSPLPVSAVVLTYNSDRTLGRVLASLQFCSEIVIVDSGSTDATLQIAERYDCKIFNRDFRGFGDQKNFAVEQASHDWVFVVDSDEVVSEKLMHEIYHEFKVRPLAADAYQMPVRLYFLGHPICYAGQQSKKSIRLFDRKSAHFDQRLVHETVQVSGVTKTLHNPLKHHSYLSLDDYLVKMNRYTSLGAKELLLKDTPSRKYKVYTSFVAQFIKFYVLKLGFLDGYHGFLWCLLSSIYPVVKYAKLEASRTEPRLDAKIDLNAAPKVAQ
jgi:glycosyltransferase involved in cell wall biosynthesis